MGDANCIHFTVNFKKESFELLLLATVTVRQLKEHLQDLTGVEPEHQKLIGKGNLQDNVTLADVPIQNGAKIMLVGTPQKDIDKIIAAKPLPQSQLSSRPVPVTRRAGGIATFDTIGADTYFGAIKVLEGWPNSQQARDILQRLSTDISITTVMKKHNWKVGVLSELTPLEVTKLGYNMNKGAEISLRLRFENGFRSYDSIKNVLYHELAHMEISEHNNDFKALNSQIRRECESVGPGRKLDDGRSYYQGPSDVVDEEVEAVDQGGVGYRLGGDETHTSSGPALTPQQAAAEAALRRFNTAPKVAPSPPPSSSKSTPNTPKATTNTPTTSTTNNSTTSTTNTKPTTTSTTEQSPTTNPPSNIATPSPETKTSTSPTVSSAQTTPQPPTTTNSTNTDAVQVCPICQTQFPPTTTERQLTLHINSCLDKMQ